MTAFAQPAPGYRTPPAIRRVLLVLAGVLAVAMVAIGTYNLLDIAARHTTTDRAGYDGVRKLVVDGSSDIRLTAAPAGAPMQVVTHVQEGLRSPERSAERRGDGTLQLSATCPVVFGIGGSCNVGYEIRVPSGTLVQARASEGDVVAEDLVSSRPIELHSSAGDVTATDLSAPAIRLSSSAGDVHARGLSGERVEAESSAGDVLVSLRERAHRLLADSGAGDVDVLVPDGIYRVDATTSAGDVDASELRTDPDSSYRITAHSSAGDVQVAARR